MKLTDCNGISVLLCSYNGEKYIFEQLESLRLQTYPIDELIILDDRSDDDTAGIISQYVLENGLEEKWNLIINEENKGWKRNFIHGISLCSGEYLFFCDQDDIWEKDKVEIITDLFENNPQADVIGTSTVEFYNDQRAVIKGANDGRIQQIDYSCSGIRFVDHPPGCAMAIRTSCAKQLIRDYKEPWAHDDFLWRYAAVNGRSYMYGKPLIRHRVSGENVTGKSMRSSDLRFNKADYNVRCYQDLLEYCDKQMIENDRLKEIIRYHIDGNELRKAFLNKPDLGNLFCLFFQYQDIYVNLKQFLGDAVIAYRDSWKKHD